MMGTLIVRVLKTLILFTGAEIELASHITCPLKHNSLYQPDFLVTN